MYAVEFIKRHKKVFGAILAIAFNNCLDSNYNFILRGYGYNGLLTQLWYRHNFAEDEDIYAAENYYKDLESGLQSEIKQY